MQGWMIKVTPIVKQHMQEAQAVQSSPNQVYNQSAKSREFQSGDQILLLVPSVKCLSAVASPTGQI